MKIELVNNLNANKLFDYWNLLVNKIPYFFQVEYEAWLNCLFNDQRDSEITFKYTATYMAEESGKVLGFIQYGKPNFHWNSKGEKYANPQIGVIRNIYFNNDRSDIGEHLIKKAEEYFFDNNLQPRYAFYHALGMSCNAGHGKLHNSMIHIDKFLKSHGFEIEHENVYYRINLENYLAKPARSILIQVKASDITKDHKQYFKVSSNGLEIGEAQVIYLRHINTVYLNWIGIKQEYKGKGFGTSFIRKLFDVFSKQGYIQMDTDTANNNITAQKYYDKNDFKNQGITRSYVKII